MRSRYNFGTYNGNVTIAGTLTVSGVSTLASLVATTADINGGTIDAVTIGTNSACTDLRVDNLKLDGNTISTTNTNGTLIILPNGTGITKIGDAGSTSHTLNTNDDLFVTGKLEVDGILYSDGGLQLTGNMVISSGYTFTMNSTAYLIKTSGNGGQQAYTSITEEVTIPVGSGLDPVVNSVTDLLPLNSTIRGVSARITQAPGGGATTLDIGTAANPDAFIDGMAVALGTTANMAANHAADLDFATDCLIGSATKIQLTTDADVTGTAMKIRLTVYYDQITAPTS